MNYPDLVQVMTHNPICVNEEDVVTKVDELFRDNTFHHIPVINSFQELIGMISRTDMDRISAGESLFHNAKKEEFNSSLYRSLRVKEIMTEDPVSKEENTSFQEVVDILQENKIRAIPITSGGKLKGIITPLDIIIYYTLKI